MACEGGINSFFSISTGDNHEEVSTAEEDVKRGAFADVRQKAVGSFTWNLPLGRGQRFGVKMPRWATPAFEAWSLSAITPFATGEPIVLTAPNQTGSAFINLLPNRICNGRDSQLANNIRNNGMLWFNTACSEVSQIGYFGNSGATVLNGPGLDNWDLALEKTFGIGRETTKLQVRADMFNVWNHAQFEQAEW